MISFRLRQTSRKAWPSGDRRISSVDESPIATPRRISLSKERIMELKIQETIAYFKRAYNHTLNSDAKCGLGYRESCAEAKVAHTPFHTALVQNDLHFVKACFEALEKTDLTIFVTTTLVQYKNEDEKLQKALSEMYKENWPEDYRSADLPEHACYANHCHDTVALQPSLPIAIAALSGNIDMVELLITRGADLFQTDERGNNILHSLILLSNEQCNLAFSMFRKIFNSIQSVAEKRLLAFKQNKDGKRPLDLAAREIKPKIMLLLLRADGVYRFPLKRCGAFQHVLYDVSDYEASGTNKIHLLQYTTTATEDELRCLQDCHFFQAEPVKTWIDAIREMERLRIIFWYIYWIVFYSMYFVGLAHYFEGTGTPTPLPLSATLAVFGFYELLSQAVITMTNDDVSDMTWRMLTRKGLPVVFTGLYRLFQSCFAVLVLLQETGHLAGFTCSVNELWYAYSYIFCTIFAFLSMFAFLLQSKSVGYLVITLEKMLLEAFIFFIIASVYFFMFPFAFSLLHTPPKCTTTDTQNLQNSTYINTGGTFTDPSLAMYDTLLLALGITVPDPLYMENAEVPLLAILLYITMIFLIGITMLNQLIAVMTDRVGQINQHKSTIAEIQRLSIALFLSGNSKLIGRLLSSAQKALYRKRTIYGNYFTSNSSGSQVFLHVIEVIPLTKKTIASIEKLPCPK